MTDWLPADHPDAPARAAAVIHAGGLVVLPTDTVYGVAAALWQPEAVAALYAAKQRPPDRAIPILLSAGDEIDQVAARVPEAARRLAAAFWPGPLTIIVPKRPGVPDIVSALPTVGVRVPDHDAARAAIRACGGALAVTSANLSDQPSALTAQDAADALGEAVGLVLDGGPAPGGTPSTVVDTAGESLSVLRPGPIGEAALREAAGN
jgi:L-threonylcarbamoyladenylate synthase